MHERQEEDLEEPVFNNKEKWWEGLVVWIIAILIGLVCLALYAAAVWLLGAIVWWCWKPLLLLLGLWLGIGTTVAATVVPDNQCHWLNVVGRSRDQISSLTMQVREEYEWRVSYNDARVIARHRFWKEWWEVTWGFPALILGAPLLISADQV